MGATITLKNIPDEIYASLKLSAQAHHRSVNGEVIACLERTLLPARTDRRAHLERARQTRAGLKTGKFKAADIARAIAQGRP